MTQRGPLDGPLETLIHALRKHAAVSTTGAEPAVVMPVINEVRAAALAYVTAVFDESGWGNVFADLHDDEDGEDLDDDGFVVEDGVERLSLTGRWDFLVRDPAALLALAADRLRAKNPGADEDGIAEHSGMPVAALDSLVAMDVGRYPGLEGAGGGWTVEPVARTLFEMAPREREETGY